MTATLLVSTLISVKVTRVTSLVLPTLSFIT